MVDLAKAQSERFLQYVKPIASKCLGMVEGNHERAIKRYCERDIYGNISAEIKTAGGFPADYKMQLGYYGWLILTFKAVRQAVPHHPKYSPRLRGREVEGR